jgi:RNA polymerase sigma-70 factor (ECF subfamily)
VTGIDDEILRRHREAETRWPEIRLGVDDFRRHLEALFAGAADRLEQIGSAHADLFVAAACLRADPAALAIFADTLDAQVRAVASAMRDSSPAPEDLGQAMWERLIVGDRDHGPRLATFRGGSSLATWLRVVCSRAAIRARGKQAHEVELRSGQLRRLEARELDPELELLRERYQHELAAAVHAAWRDLDDRPRNVLRLHLLDGMPLHQIGSIYQVHESTASRWCARARESLLRDVQRKLGDRLDLSARGLASVYRLVESRLELSLTELIRVDDEA